MFVGLNYAFDALGALELVPLVSGVGRAFPGFALAQGVVELALQHAAGAEYVVPSGGATVASLALAAACVGGACCALIAVADASAGVRAVAEECFSSEAEIRRLKEKGPAPDEDVLEEERRVREDDRREEGERHGVGARGDDGDATSPPRSKNGGGSSSPRDAVRLMGLQKMYLGKTTPAVRDLWLGVAPGECFGLLGINGCGKTTTFRIAAGDLPPTRGRVSIAAGAGGVGYCPQRDAVFPALTVVEHLRLARAARNAARTRDSADVYDGDVDDGDARDASFTDSSVGAAILDAGLERFADVPAGHLSGGNKRKLCLAMSLLGLEKGGLALLDEPTAGARPRRARRHHARRSRRGECAEVRGRRHEPQYRGRGRAVPARGGDGGRRAALRRRPAEAQDQAREAPHPRRAPQGPRGERPSANRPAAILIRPR